ncbi:MAG TPA: DNA translocase FtsK 4TM domain-containing protein, partial [Edaphobacter sp.]
MKTLRLVSTPTRNRRLNEIIGLTVLVSACLLTLALVSYTPMDRSFNTVGGFAAGRPAHNWTGIAGAYLSDTMLQAIGVAAFFLPLVIGRLGVCWMMSRPAGSPVAKFVGLMMWVVFGPAAIALFPGHLRWRGALPIEGVTGRLLADMLVSFLNLPGASIVLALMVSLSLYLATTFTFNTAREWATMRFGFAQAMWERWSAWRERRRGRDIEEPEYGSKRERAEMRAQRAREMEEHKAREAEARLNEPNKTLLGSLFGWLSRRKKFAREEIVEDSMPAAEATMWQSMPRTMVDAPPVTPLSTATAAAAPFSEALARAAAPVRAIDDASNFSHAEEELPQIVARVSAPPPVKREAAPAPAAFSPMPVAEPAPAEEAISFGKRADADIKAVAIAPKSVRGYKLPPSSLLYRSDEKSTVREDQLREEARILVEKCAEFDVDGQVTHINPGPVVTTFEFKPDAGVKYAKVTGLADDLCLAMAAESILIERMAGKSTVGIQVPNSERETIWLRDVVECESFAQSKSRLAIALGKDINGRIVTGDLAGMPHVLIAGSTGSGKSVAINAMIMSVLFKSTPEQVRMILVDPKRVELGMYEGIPHLFTPIITEAKLAANALRNAVKEMERRLKLLAANHVRNIDQFNKLFDHGSGHLFEDVNQEPLPYIMIIIDELADLMMLDRANVEEAITR